MRVLHLSTYDRFGGACIAAYRQHTGLRRSGIDSQMWVRHKVTDDPYVHQFIPSSKPLARSSRIVKRQYLQHQRTRLINGAQFSDDRSEHGGLELSEMPASDIVNVQFAWGFVHFPALLRGIPYDVPIVVTMHDMSPFTGGCAYDGQCSRFQQQCGNCPLMKSDSENDLSRRVWERKYSLYHSRPKGKVHFVADSHWLADEAKKSSLLSGLPVSVIHYGLDMEVYRPLSRSFARDVLQIPQDMPVISFAAASVDDERKGFKYLIEALRLLPNKPFLLTWGRNFLPELNDIPHRHLGNIDNEYFMSLAYNAADVFVMSSLEEAFGQTALESIACGTPVAAFSAGGIVDTVRHEQTGIVAQVGDSRQLSEAVNRLLNDRELWCRLSKQGREWALKEFSMELNASKYVDLYSSLLNNNG